MSKRVAVVLAVLLVTAAVPATVASGPATTATETGAQDGSGYAGAHVSFESSGNAVTDYSVDGTVVFDSVEVQPQSEYEAGAGVDLGVGASAVTDVAGVDLSLDASTETRAEVATDSSASMTAHDSERGVLTVDAGGEDHYVEVALADDGEASQEGDRVVVEGGDREGAFLVVGDGEVAVNDDGGVTADLGSDASLVFRSADDGERDEDDSEQERMIAEGTATVDVYAEERDGAVVADAATYAEGLTVDARSEGEERVEMMVDRAESEGTVVVTSVSEAAIGAVESADDVSVTVDGEAAAEASSYSELEGGIGEEPRYMVRQSGEASASADVLVAVDHFSERDVTIEGDEGGADDGAGDDATGDDGSGDGDDSDAQSGDDTVPGFGAAAALLALLGAAGRLARP